MNTFVIIGIIFAVLVILAYIPIGIGAKYDNGVFVIVKISVFKFNIKLNKKVKKLSKKDDKSSSAEEEINKSIIGLDFILSLLGDFRRFVRKRFSLEDFNINIVFGTSEASSTAVASGAFWALIYNLIGLIDMLVQVKKPYIDIKPIFNDAVWNLTAEGVIVSRPVHVVATAFVFVCKFLKYKKSRRTNK